MPSTYRHIGEAAPYYDDYVGSKHDDKGYVKVLWKPSRAVQARELTQMQTYLQNQTASLGGYLFKDGTVVQGGIISTTTKQKYFIGRVKYPAGITLEDAMASFIANNKIRSNEDIGNRGLYLVNGIGSIKFQLVGWTTLYDNHGNVSNKITATDERTGMTETRVVVFYNIFGGSLAYLNDDGSISLNSELGEQCGAGLTFESPTDSPATLIIDSLVNKTFFNSDSNSESIKNGSITDVYKTCTCASCTQGTIFVDGYFVNCPMASVMVNPILAIAEDSNSVTSIEVASIDSEDYRSKTTSADGVDYSDIDFYIGFWIERKIVDSYEDETLTDPAGGTYNHKAPGADRYSILAKLRCFSSDDINKMIEDGDNILLVNSVDDMKTGNGATEGIKFAGGIVMRNNVVIKEQSNIGTNSALMDELAKRTYEESGNYTVKPWKVQLKEHKDLNNLEENETLDDYYDISVGPGLGYVYGYRVSTCVSQVISNKKAREKIIHSDNSKYTEDSLHVLSDDIYTLNDDSISPQRNINSWHIENVASASKVYLLDRKISEILRYNKTDDSWSSHIISLNDSTTEDAISIFLASEEKATTDINNEVVSLGTCSIVDISSNGQNNLKISVLDVNVNENGICSSLSSVSSIASFALNENNRYILTGYIDLLSNGEGNTTIWKNVESPLIFELDWPYVAPDDQTNMTFVCSAIAEGVAEKRKISSDEYSTVVTFTPPSGISIPSEASDINFLVHKNSGTVIPASKINVNGSFNVTGKEEGILVEGGTYCISYRGSGTISPKNNKIESSFKEKVLEIAQMTLTSDELSGYLGRYNESKDDVIVLKCDRDETTGKKEEPVTDLVKILGIKRITSDSDIEELYWPLDSSEASSDLASSITIFDGCTDYGYEASTIKGFISWCSKSLQPNATTISESYKITFAYWNHISKSGNFYYAGSYKTGDSVQFSSTDQNVDIYKTRLAEWYNVSYITENAYAFIPKYKSKNGAWYDLANCLDFRIDEPLVDSYASSSSTPIKQPIIPRPASGITYDIATYLPRIDSVWVDKNGTFGVSKGISSESPVPPKDLDGTLVLYHLYNKPYGKSINEIVPEYIDNRRHTMIDITAIANRLSNLEEVVSLSMSEQSAVNMQIVDGDGTNRFKCGIFTDSFSSFENCDFSNSEWSATIDTVEKCIRANFELKNWSFSPVGNYIGNGSNIFELENITAINGGNPNPNIAIYGQKQSLLDENAITGGTILTIAPSINPDWEKLTDDDKDIQKLPSQYSWPYAHNDAITEATNLQSMMFVTWNGNLVLTPAIDTWTEDLGEFVTETWNDTERPPDTFRSWTTTTDGTTTQSTVKQTIPSGMTYKDLDKLYGKPWREVPKEQRVTHLPGWWEPATTLTEVATYKTTTTKTVTEKTTYTGSWQANDVSTYMEQQAAWMRVRDVKFEIEGMRPNQRLNAAMDKIPLKLIAIEQYKQNSDAYTDFIKTDEKGRAIGYFKVPENMPVGTKTVEFFDDEETTAAIADYTANGKTVWTNVDRNYIRVWNAEVSESEGPETTTVGKKLSSTMTSTATAIFHNNDPIAESFYVEEQNGITLESIQIFFASKDPSVGVEIFIVECENGYPGQTVVPFSRVFVASKDVNVCSKDDIADGKLIPTTFQFPVPVQLQGLTEYAFIVIASSYNYEIYTSTLGKADMATGIGVREQPYVGSMFKSQNLRTWTAEPLSDIAFRMFRYKFPTNTACTVDFALDDLTAKNTGLFTSLPETADNAFYANAMTISVGTYIPNATSINFEWYPAHSYDDKAVPFTNKQDIFITDKDGLSLYNAMETSGNTTRYHNRNSNLKVRATLSTNDSNIAPQIDMEDFHGIFTKNLVNIDKENPAETVNGISYYDAGTYVSNTIALKDPAIGIRVAVDAMLPEKSFIRAYFKTTAALNTSIYTWWTANLAARDAVYHINTSPNQDEVPLSSRMLPGYQESAWKEICNERVYIWYYIYDAADHTKKFITPNQYTYHGKSIDGYTYSSCILKSKNIYLKEEDALTETKTTTNDNETPKKTAAANIILQDPVNLNIVLNPISYKFYETSSDNTSEDKNVKMIINYNDANANTNCIILGVLAVANEEPFNPESFLKNINANPASQNSSNPHYQGISCEPYDSTISYHEGDLCIHIGSIWKCTVDTITGLSPVDDALSWKKIPCALMVSDIRTQDNMESQWIELDVNEYKNSTERQTNFMEYNYSLAPSLELNEFDSFILKFKMLTTNSKDIPRFRNLRAVAVY